MNRNVVLSGFAVAMSIASCSAVAADAPARPAPEAVLPYVPPPRFDWSGFYIGANAGMALKSGGTSESVGRRPARGARPATVRRKEAKASSFTGGVQIGYNFQKGSTVLGVETDFNYVDLENKFARGSAARANGLRQKLEWFGTVRARAGFTSDDRVLVFVTGGLAYGKVKSLIASRSGNAVSSAGKDSIRVGWTLGAGVEYALTDNLIVKGEYAYVNLGQRRVAATDAAGRAVSNKAAANFHVVRAGLAYKF